MSAGVTALMEHRLEDEKQKQDLEYRMLQNQINPHFIYNTLNSIKWMATIQHAPGIAEDGHGAVPSAQEHLQEQRAPCAAV